MIEPNKPFTGESVPLHEADVDRTEKVKLINGKLFDLQGGRRIEIWRLEGQPGLAIRIFRPTNDGKISKLFFGLNEDAATALMMGLAESLYDFIPPESS